MLGTVIKLKKKIIPAKPITVVELIKVLLNALLYFQVRILDSVLIVSIVRTRVVPLSDHVLPTAVTRHRPQPSIQFSIKGKPRNMCTPIILFSNIDKFIRLTMTEYADITRRVRY